MDTSSSAPRGCGSTLSSIYYNLCDLTTIWGIVLEAIAIVGVLTSFVVFLSLIGRLQFVIDKKRKDMVVLQAGTLAFTLGLFGLTFAFIIGQYHITCATRRFLFGALFSGCFACLVMHGLWIALLERKGPRPRRWMFWSGALALWLIEIIINTEWLIVTMARNPSGQAVISDLSCSITNEDFVMALIYVMVLLVAVVLVAVPSVTHKGKRWRKDGAFILVTGLCTMVIWVAWIVMYLFGNQMVGNPTWDDPTLAVAVVSNAWVFICLYTIPGICLLTKEDPDPQRSDDEDQVQPATTQVDDNVKEPQQQNLGIENRAFSVDEPRPGQPTEDDFSSPEPSARNVPIKAPPPYRSLNSPLRSGVYQPTPLTMIMQGLANRDQSHEAVIFRANLHQRPTEGGSSSPPSADF